MKSHVTMEQHQCLVCTKLYDTGAVLLDRRLREVFEMHTLTGHGNCEECQRRFDDGYIAIIEVTNPAPAVDGATLAMGEETRTGRIMWMKHNLATQVLNCPVEPVMFAPQEAVAILEQIGRGPTEGETVQ